MKKCKKLLTLLLALGMLLTMIPQTVFADSVRVTASAKTSGAGNQIKILRVSYETDWNKRTEKYTGEFDVKFRTPVQWKYNAKITSIKDNKGTSYKGYLTDRDSDDCEITVPNIKPGRTYTIVINGIKKRYTSSYRKLTLTIKVPAESNSTEIALKRVTVDEDNDDYDQYATEIDVKFASKVSWKRNAKVSSVKDSQGKTYKGYLTDCDDDECEIYIRNMKYNKTYTIKISGIKARGASSYGTFTFKVKVPARNNNLAVKKVDYDVDYDDYYDDYYDDDYYDDDYDDYYDDYYDDDRYQLTFDFNKDVIYKHSSYIIVKDSAGNAYSSKSSYIEWDDDECELYLNKPLKKGKTYTYQIVNVKARGAGSYVTLKGSFIA